MKTRAALVLLLVSSSAFAEDRVVTLDRTCVAIDTETDGLTPADRERVTLLMQRVLERENLLVVTTGCTETFTLSHELQGTSYVIRLRSSAGKRRMTTPALDDLAAKYQKLAHSLVETKDLITGLAPPPDAEVAPQAAAYAQTPSDPLATLEAQAARHPEPTDTTPRSKRHTLYARLGTQLVGGMAWGFGYRRNFGTVSLDVALDGRESDGEGTDATSFAIELLRNKRLAAAAIAYVGAGFSLGKMSRGEDYYYYPDNFDYYWGSGLQGELTAGMQFGKSSGMQFLAQLDITLPFYEMGNHNGEHDYAGAAMISGGFGF